MTVYRPADGITYRYDFRWRKTRYAGSTDLTTKAEAEEFEANLRRKLRRQRAGLDPADASDTPTFTEWAVITYRHRVTRGKRKLKRPEQFATNLRMVLGFFGRRPTKTPPLERAPYHNLRLGDVIEDPSWIERFETWMDRRDISGSRKNHYRSACSVMYKVALLPTHRKQSQVHHNPFEHIERDAVRKRITTYPSPEALRKVISQAVWHIRVALAIGALAPKLRLRNVLALRWDLHVDVAKRILVDPDHKTDRQTGLPLVTHMSGELLKVLEAAHRGRRGRYVVHWYGRSIRDIKTGLKRAVIASGLVWGRAAGVTYHTLRHTMATDLVRMRVSGPVRDRVMGWIDPQTSETYEHMVPIDEIEPLEILGARWPMADLMEPVEQTVGPVSPKVQKPSAKRKFDLDVAIPVELE